MKCNANGRTYRLRVWFPFFKISCDGCAFSGLRCPLSTGAATCTKGDGINRVWRETLPSMARRVAIYVLVGERNRYDAR